LLWWWRWRSKRRGEYWIFFFFFFSVNEFFSMYAHDLKEIKLTLTLTMHFWLLVLTVKPENNNPIKWRHPEKFGHLKWSQTAVFSANCTLKWEHLWIKDTFGSSHGCPYVTGFAVQWNLWIATLWNGDILGNKDTCSGPKLLFSMRIARWNENTFELRTLLAHPNGVLIS
jgi:hypothetical protein